MARAKPIDAPDCLERRKDSQMITQVREYRLITPLFGGGVEPGEADPVTVIRASEIRGHLRFWWRATRGGQFDENLEKMSKAENLLWGGTSTEDEPRPSQVAIAVEIVSIGLDVHPFEVYQDTNQYGNIVYRMRWRRDSKIPAYAAFPLQPSRDELRKWNPVSNETRSVRANVLFKIILSFPASWRNVQEARLFPQNTSNTPQEEILAALWAWETFGGIGARTRRGFGALQCIKIDEQTVIPLPVSDVRSNILKNLTHHICGVEWPNAVPHLSTTVLFKVAESTIGVDASWNYLIDKLRDFRQARNRRNDNPRRPGRSRWPEPDEIRRRVPKRYTRHAQPVTEIRAFPRAVFGLPIIFHFQDMHEDPGDTTLTGINKIERLASPLILRPYMCSDNYAVGLALVLNTPKMPPGGLYLEGAHRQEPIHVELSPEDASSLTDANNLPLLGTRTDVLFAFLDRLKEAS